MWHVHDDVNIATTRYIAGKYLSVYKLIQLLFLIFFKSISYIIRCIECSNTCITFTTKVEKEQRAMHIWFIATIEVQNTSALIPLSLWTLPEWLFLSVSLSLSLSPSSSLSQRHFPRNGFLQIVIETTDTTPLPVNGRGVSGWTPWVESIVRFSSSDAQSGVTSGETRISTSGKPLTWSNLKSYQSHLCQFSCLVWWAFPALVC